VGITDITTIGAIRASLTRHGAGPFPTQISTNELDNPHERNVYNTWQQNFKKGWQDLELIRYAIKMHKLEGLNIDQLAVTCLDALPDRTSVCTNYEKPVLPDVPITDLGALSRLSRSLSEATPVYDVVSKDRVAHYLSDQLGIPLMITSHGPTHLEKKWDYQN
jgi:adenylosuccinate synthase